jgi:KTSC domain
MEMTKVNSGKLRAIGHDSKTRTLRVELDDGSALEYFNVSDDLWRGCPMEFLSRQYRR